VIEIEPLSVEGTVLGYGRSTTTLASGKVLRPNVYVVAGALRPDGSDTGPAPLCSPNDPATVCGPNRTCALAVCAAPAQAEGMCFAAGPGVPGQACEQNWDCAVRSQCFEMGRDVPGCAVKTCLRFCNADADCAEAGALCNTSLACGLKVCSRPCDPRGAATTGCAAGLNCFIYSAESTDCACPGSRGAGVSGTACATDAQCGPGYLCVTPEGRCHPVCRRSDGACPTGTTCTALSGYTLYGACL
jgi:hypothetical protein